VGKKVISRSTSTAGERYVAREDSAFGIPSTRRLPGTMSRRGARMDDIVDQVTALCPWASQAGAVGNGQGSHDEELRQESAQDVER